MKKILIFIVLSLFLGTNSYGADLWRAGTGEETILGSSNASDIDSNSFTKIVSPLDRLLDDYREGVELLYASASTLTVTDGEIVCENTAGTVKRFRENTSNTTVTWSSIDTGAEAASTTYYIYAISDTDATTFTILISASSTTPTGATYYKLLGSFYNNASSNIDSVKVNSSKLVYDTDEKEPDYDSGWFTANVSTKYTKAHGISNVVIPTDALLLLFFWRSSGADTEIAPITTSADVTGFRAEYDATNIEVSGDTIFGTPGSLGSGNYTNGELRILAYKVIVDF